MYLYQPQSGKRIPLGLLDVPPEADSHLYIHEHSCEEQDETDDGFQGEFEWLSIEVD